MKRPVKYHLNKLPLTRIKLVIAALIYKILAIYLKKTTVQVVRRDIRYELDISEGIELYVFLFGHFQKHIVTSKLLNLPQDAIILDIGANIGTMSLMFARLYNNCNIISVEPADLTFSKLLRNLSLNPDINNRIRPIKAFISDTSDLTPPKEVYSSWKLNSKKAIRHEVHSGIRQPSSVDNTTSIDDLCKTKGIATVDLIKIDTEGLEYSILKGAEQTIKTFRPGIIFEVGNYIMDEYGICFFDYFNLFKKHHYTLYCLKSYKIINDTNYRFIVPERSTIDILAVPQNM